MTSDEWRMMTDNQKAEYCKKIAEGYPEKHKERAKIMQMSREIICKKNK